MSAQELKGLKQFSNNQFPTLAIDFGERRLGIAVSDSNGLIGSPLETLIRGRNSSYDQVIEDICTIANQYRVKSILIGLPTAYAQSHEKIRTKIVRFSELLSEAIDLEIFFYDESFSSYDAENIIHSQQRTLSPKSGRVDKLSAALFLQKFLDEVNTNNTNK